MSVQHFLWFRGWWACWSLYGKRYRSQSRAGGPPEASWVAGEGATEAGEAQTLPASGWQHQTERTAPLYSWLQSWPLQTEGIKCHWPCWCSPVQYIVNHKKWYSYIEHSLRPFFKLTPTHYHTFCATGRSTTLSVIPKQIAGSGAWF